LGILNCPSAVALLIDLHTHSYPMSDDSFLSVDELIEGTKAAGLDGICLTDHDAFWTEERVHDLSLRHGFLVLPGSEINTDAGHVLAFGLHRYEFGMHKPDYLRACADREGGVLIAAHPYRRRFLEDPGRVPEARAEMLERAIADPFFDLCDAVEGHNGRGSLEQNRYTVDLCESLSLPSVAGSDAHRTAQIGTAATELMGKVECLGDLLRLIKSGNCRAVDLVGTPGGEGGPPRCQTHATPR
jgi:predicted metal-dependent phosphoesterase TrpH